VGRRPQGGGTSRSPTPIVVTRRLGSAQPANCHRSRRSTQSHLIVWSYRLVDISALEDVG
jgi:hypothetical protein